MTQTFTPPTAKTTPPFTPDTSGVQMRLARYREVLSAGVCVMKLSDGTYVQDIPTAENTNTNVPPYPLMPDQSIVNLISRSYGIPSATGPRETDTSITPYVTVVYYGGHKYPVSAAEAAALTAYTAHGAGYSDCLT